MNCPRCDYHSPYEQVRCPGCFSVFGSAALEELGHLRYLRERLDGWRAAGLLPENETAAALVATEERLGAIEIALGLRPAPAPEPAPAPLAPPVAQEVAPPPPVIAPEPIAPPLPAPPPLPVETLRPDPTPPVPVLARAEEEREEAQEEVPAATPPARPTAPPAPPRPAFSWGQLGTYLLSERTLNGLLSLGAFLILASGTVISTINPTDLDPIKHFASTVVTTLLFFLAGVIVRQKLTLPRTGAVLLAIGAAFIPLTVWTLGHEILDWEPDAIWLAAALVCLPIYLGAHLLLRDRTFALLTAIAGGAEIFTVLAWLGVPAEWRLVALLLLAARYLTLGTRLGEGWAALAWALRATAQLAVPSILIATIVGRALPVAWEVATGVEPNLEPYSPFGIAVAVAWWLGAAYYALAARRLPGRGFPFVAPWIVPVALLLTLAATDLDRAWYNFPLATLALGALVWGRWGGRALTGVARPSLAQLLGQPAYQVALALPIGAALWPWQEGGSRLATLGVVSISAVLAAWLFRHPALRYAATYVPALTLGLGLRELGVWGVPGFAPAWQGLGVAAIALGYLIIGRFVLGVGRRRPVGYDALAAEPAYQVALTATVVAALWPAQTLASRVPTLFAIAGTYALAAWLFRRTAPRAVAAYLLPVAVGYGLELAAGNPALAATVRWHNVAWAALAGVYFLFARFALRAGREPNGAYSYAGVAREPVWHAIPPLTVLALLVRPATPESQLVAALAVALLYGAATFLLRQRIWAWPAALTLPVAVGSALDLLALGDDARTLAWAVAAVALLAAAEIAARRVGEARRPLLETVVGLDGPRSRFAAPLFATGYGLGALALGLALLRYESAPLAGYLGGRYLPGPVLGAFAVLVAALVASAVTRRASRFLYAAVTLLPLPFLAGTALLARGWNVPFADSEAARALAALGGGYLLTALATDRAGVRFAAPLWLAGYGLAALTPILAANDRAATVQVLGLTIVVLAASAWLAHRDRHPTFAAFARATDPDPASAEGQTVRALFLYGAAWLVPVWTLLALSLWRPEPEGAVYGLALAILAPLYALLGQGFGAIRPAYRWPFFICGYTLAAVGPLVALPDETLRIAALALGIGLWIGSAVASRRAAWLWAVALTTPILAWEIAISRDVAPRHAGLVALALSLAYSVVGAAVHGGRRGPLGPIRGTPSRHAWPFFATGQPLLILGLLLSAVQDRPLLVAGFALGACGYVLLATIFRQPAFGWPIVGTATIAYAVWLSLTPLPERAYGLGLLPLLAVALAVADLLRRRLDNADPARAARPWETYLLDAWATPFYTLAYGGTFAAIALSWDDSGILALACWGVAALYALSVALFRQPLPLYPALGAALAALVASAHTLRPDLSDAGLMALLIVPAWALTWGADVIAGRRGRADRQADLRWPALGAERLLADDWAAPPLLFAFGTLILATLGGAGEVRGGLLAALAGAILLGLVAARWRGEIEAGGAIALGTLAFAQAIRLSGIAGVEQAPLWAIFALGLTLVAIGSRAPTAAALDPWRRPLSGGAIVLAGWALALGTVNAVVPDGQQPLAATLALTGLTLIAHGFDRRERLLGYAGVACLEGGYMIQLLLFRIEQPQLFVLPVGAYLLTIAFLEWRRGGGAGIKAALEVAALTLLLTVSAIQALGFLGQEIGQGTDRTLYGSFMVLEGVVLFGLGAILRWRRTFFGGALGLVLAVAIMLIDPVQAVDKWYLVAIVGFAMIALVIFIEGRRQQIPVWLGEWRARLETWD